MDLTFVVMIFAYCDGFIKRLYMYVVYCGLIMVSKVFHAV